MLWIEKPYSALRIKVPTLMYVFTAWYQLSEPCSSNAKKSMSKNYIVHPKASALTKTKGQPYFELARHWRCHTRTRRVASGGTTDEIYMITCTATSRARLMKSEWDVSSLEKVASANNYKATLSNLRFSSWTFVKRWGAHKLVSFI